MAGPDTPTQVQINDKADLDSWLRDTLHPADNTTLHVHFIDYDTPRDLTELYTALDDATRKKPSVDSPSTSSIVDKLVRDIRALCLFTDGVLMSWSGRKMTLGNDDGESSRGTAKQPQTSGHDDSKRPQDRVLHKTFMKLMKDDNVQDFRGGRSRIVTLHYASQEGGVSSRCTHPLMLTSKDTNLMQDTRQTLLTTSVREGDKRPVVCVLVGGDTESLKTAVTAVSNNIPVIVMKGSGGFADLLAWLYEKAKLEYRRQREAKKVKTVTVRVVDEDTMDMITAVFEGKPDIMESLATLIKNLHLLTVYNPLDIPPSHDQTTQAPTTQAPTTQAPTTQDSTAVTTQASGNMDAAILEALIRHNQESKIEVFLMTMKRRQKLVHAPPSTYSQTVVENETLQLDCFIDCLLSRSPAAVSAFLSHLKPNFFDFHMGRLLRLYEADVRFLRSHKLTEEDRDKPFARFLQARRDLKKYTGSVSRFPLRCPGDKCKACSLGNGADPVQAEFRFPVNCQDPMQESKARFLQTCLHPVQELFLWSLLSGSLDLTVTLWKYCKDKMAASLFARAVFLGISGAQDNDDIKKELAYYGKRFEELAVATLKAANELDEKKTRDLINKECPWWDGVCVLELARFTKCKLFIAQQPCRDQLTREWHGYLGKGQTGDSRGQKKKPNEESTDKQRRACFQFCSRSNKESKDEEQRQGFFQWPKLCFLITMVWQIAFLALYSYVLLFDLRDTPSPAFIVLMVWVSDTACEEISQLLTSSMKVGGKKDGLLTRVKAYWSQEWNKLDVFSVAGFVLGVILVLVPRHYVKVVGRWVMAVDVFVFFLRFLQILMVFRELGLLLVIAERMVKDSARFMVILLTVMLGYVVASESVLYPDMHFSWPTLYRLPFKALWQTFGELGLEEIQQDECQRDDMCPSSYGQYLVPAMVALYVIASNVLLLNLLIARFNATFEAVKEEAERHQAWQYCQLVQEYKNRSLLPPPCKIMRLLLTTIVPRSKCCQSESDQTADVHNQRQHHEPETEPFMPDNDEPPRTPPYKPPELSSSAEGKCVTISNPNSMQYFTVELRDTNNVFQSAHSYSVPSGTHRVMLWREDPTLTVTINGAYFRPENMEEVIEERDQVVFSAHESIEISEQALYLKRWQLQKFEDEQAMYALSETYMLDNTQANTPAWVTQLFGSIDHKIQTAVKSALNTKVTPNTPAGSSQEASSLTTAPTQTAVKPSPANEDTPPAWATRLFDSMDKMEAVLRAQYRPSLVLTAQGKPPRELFQRPAVQ